MAIKASNIGVSGVLSIIAVVLLIVFAVNFIAMLVFGAAAGYYAHTGPGFWQTFFSLWSIGIVGASFNGTRVSHKG